MSAPVGSRALLLKIRGELSQDELSCRAGVGRVTLARWESEAREPRLSELRRLAASAGKRVEITVLADAEADHIDLVHEQLDIGPTARVRLLAGEHWPALRAALCAAARVEKQAVVLGPAAAALRGAAQQLGSGRVELLTTEEESLGVIGELIDDAGAESIGYERTLAGNVSRQLFAVESGGVVSLATETESGIDVAAVREGAHVMVLNEEAIGCVRVALVEDLLAVATSSTWPEDGPTRPGLRAVLASGRYSTRKPPEPVELV